MTLIIAGVVRVPPENLEGLRPHMLVMLAASRAEEGCLEYTYAEDIADPGLIPKAVEELMRRYAIATAGRILVQDHDYKGVVMKAGDMVIMPTVAVSFDESRFDDPLKVDFTRNASGHAAFSRGVHTCVGSMLARTELRIFMEEWLARIPEFRVKPGFELQISSGTVSGIRKLPLEWNVG